MCEKIIASHFRTAWHAHAEQWFDSLLRVLPHPPRPTRLSLPIATSFSLGADSIHPDTTPIGFIYIPRDLLSFFRCNSPYLSIFSCIDFFVHKGSL